MLEIPGYRIEDKIAEGGMASVYRAVQESLQRPVAIKVLHDRDEPGFSQRFMAEGRIVATLRHPAIITIYDIGIAGGRPFIAMELVEGGDLERRIAAGLQPEQALAILRRLVLALDYVHGQGVVHRDIKPGNILFRQDDEPLLGDFGIAKQMDIDLKLTRDDLALGSPYYLSPEQGQGKPVDGRSDIYSLGILLYEMLSGRPPFRGKTPMDLMLQHLREPLPPLKKSLRPFQPLLEQMTAKEPMQRPRDCATLLRALDSLESALAQLPAPPSPKARPKAQARAPAPDAQRPRRPMRLWWVAGLLFIVFLLLNGPHHLLVLTGLTQPATPGTPRIHWQGKEASATPPRATPRPPPARP
jgi:serine/threonine-protein kinase PpkA